MANFHTHLITAAASSIALSATGLYAGLYGMATASLLTIIGTLGGLLPDIDLEHSKPAKQGFVIAALIASTLATILYANRYRETELVLDSLILWAGSFVFLRFVVFELFSRLTVHRGMVHSVPYMAVFALILTNIAFYGLKLTAFVSWLFGLFLFFGSLIHLLLDEIYSVNVFGLKVKKSFGTAIKFFERQKIWQYALLYLMIAVLFYVAPQIGDTLMGIKNAGKSLLLKLT